jgi:hypothetical protein
MSEMPKRELLVKRIADGFIAERKDVTGWSERDIRAQIGGMLINADTDNWLIIDTAWSQEP